ncbi:FAD-binding oxidoreductase [Nocardioides speluncae]|uniref:FAD-binding oxidoreductase n=1 Tax=Nocardioides speluncae TaxID=2670337 RepID=UPI001F0C7090|nr:FAD-binding oxidoreductase [Nocardioides speluncae]
MTTMTDATARSLATALDGQVLLPGDDGYDGCRAVWNAMVDRRPRVIVRCASTADVVAAVRYAREHDLELGVRCGGHSVIGHGVPEDGLMLDLTPYAAVRVDPDRQRAWVQGGALLGALDVASLPHGLATTAGNVSHTGVGGLTLGGGMGWLARQYGLTCDNVVSFEVVTAAGDLVRASADEHPDLYWALRGGGGNFGIVTEFEFQLHRTDTRSIVAEFYHPIESAAEVFRRWRDLNAEADRRATFTAWVGSASQPWVPTELQGRPLAYVGTVWVGNPADAESLLADLRGLGSPVAERVQPMSYLELQTMDDTVEDHAYRRYWKGHLLDALPDDAIDAFLLRGTPDGHGDLLPAASLQAYGGAIAGVADADTAYSRRDTMFEFVAASRWDDAGEDEGRIDAARRYGRTIEPFASGKYVNAMSDEGIEGVRRAYSPAKLARLVAVKDRYDPDNIFHLNANIPPSTAR